MAVTFLILPYLLFANFYISLAFTVFNAMVLIFVFTYYISVARDIPFKSRFLEMASISVGVAALTFGIGFLVRTLLGVEV